MTVLDEMTTSLGAALLPVVAGLLLEELTFGGLVRLLIAPRPKTNRRAASHGTDPPVRCRRPERKRPEEETERNGERTCSH